MRLGDLGVGWEKEMKADMEKIFVQAQVYSTCGITRDSEITRFVINKRKIKESQALIKEFGGWRRGEIGRSVFAKLVVHQAHGDAHAEKDVS
jgi:hypothetical protein